MKGGIPRATFLSFSHCDDVNFSLSENREPLQAFEQRSDIIWLEFIRGPSDCYVENSWPQGKCVPARLARILLL